MRKRWMIWLLVLCACLTGCSASDGEMSKSSDTALTESAYLAEATRNTDTIETGAIPLFYTNQTYTSLYEVEKDYDFSDQTSDEILQTVLTDLSNTAAVDEDVFKDIQIQPIIPEGILESAQLVQRIKQDDPEAGECTVLEFCMTNLYYDMSLNQRIVLRAGLSRTIFSAGIAERIEFQAPDREQEDGHMVVVNTSSVEDKLIINQYSQDFYTDEVKVTLYFGNEKGTALKKETRTLTLEMTEALPMAIMKALIAGPETEGYTTVIPQDTMIEDIFIKDGVCYVDLNAEFQKNHLGGETEEKLTIYSIVNSLLNVSSIQYVQFLIEGKKVEYYKSYVKIDHFLTSNTEIVE